MNTLSLILSVIALISSIVAPIACFQHGRRVEARVQLERRAMGSEPAEYDEQQCLCGHPVTSHRLDDAGNPTRDCVSTRGKVSELGKLLVCACNKFTPVKIDPLKK